MTPRAAIAAGAVALLVLAGCSSAAPPRSPDPRPAGARDPRIQPFSSTSIWNTPIGSGAVYVPAGLAPTPDGETDGRVPQVDDEPIVMTPDAPETPIVYSDGGFGGDRCRSDPARVLRTAPIPEGYVLPSTSGNQSSAILGADGRTVINVQPLARCEEGGPATSIIVYPDTDLYGDGRDGAHGGAGLSALGGSIRLGELRPGQPGPQHVLKVNVYARGELARCTSLADCSRWPARKADTSAAESYGSDGDQRNRAMAMGSLLALPPSVDIDRIGLTTEPGRQLAWTLQNYGAYIVDDADAPSFALNAEGGPAGSVREQFADDWGYDFEVEASDDDNPWANDVRRIRPLLAAVTNNGPGSVGGGGTPRRPLLPALSAAPPKTVVAPPLADQPDPPDLIR